MRADRLRTEYLDRPLGLGRPRPRLTWVCRDGVAQQAYRVVAVRTPPSGEPTTVWDTGRVESPRMWVDYEGATLGSRDRVDWTVTLWDQAGDEGEPQTSWFELGLLDPTDWTASWVTADRRSSHQRRYPVDCFRRRFDAGEVVRARLYASALGLYEARLNGQRVGDLVLTPGSTDYRKRVHYQAYDVTALVSAGSNELTVDLADGWYRGSLGAYGITHVFGDMTQLICQLELTYADGRRETIGSDGSWEWSDDGPVRFADLKDGEHVEAGMTPSYDGNAKPVRQQLVPTAGDQPMPKEQEVFTPAETTTPAGRRLLDLGQNIAGYVRCRVSGPAGARVRLRFGEILDEHGELTQKNFQVPTPVRTAGPLERAALLIQQVERLPVALRQTPLQEVTIACGAEPYDYTTRFAVFGFRYVEVVADPGVELDGLEAVAVYSDLEWTGSLSCSDEGVNRYLENTRWSMKGNFLDVPTDCPTRERLGWTGDAQIFLGTSAYLADVAAFFRKWLVDLSDSMAKGRPLAVAPYNGMTTMYTESGSTAGWGDATVLVPYGLWQRYGDDRFLIDAYPMMRDWAQWLIAHTGHKQRKAAKANPYGRYVMEKGLQLGEWLEPEEFKDPLPTGFGPPIHAEVATAYLHLAMRLMTEIATYLGHGGDAARFQEYAAGAKQAYEHLFVADGTIDTDRQAKLVRPLALGLVDGDVRERVADRLVQAVEKYRYRVGTGFLSTPFLLPVLTETGHLDVAYRMLQNHESPGWLSQVDAGATTVWEDWEGAASQNHYAPGSVCQWLFDTMAGIRVAGERRFVIAPQPGGTVTWTEASYESPYGLVSSRWSLDGGESQFTVTVPPNTTAEVRLPDGSVREVGPGTHVVA